MNPMKAVVDCNGTPVRVGDSVRLLQIEGSLLERVPDKEAVELRAMIGEVFEITEIDAYGMAWISKTVECGDGHCSGHSLALGAGEMERVATPNAS